MRRFRQFGALALSLGLWACSQKAPDGTPASVALPSATAQPASPEVLAALREAEHRRRAVGVSEEAVNSPNVATRQAAARALARIAGPEVRPSLLTLLSDEDAEVVRFAAYGLGFECSAGADAVVSALAARAVSLPSEEPWDAAHLAVMRAIGACSSSPKAEPTLAAWLTNERRGCGGALGLGDLAGRTRRLREETWVSLLNRAQGSVSSPACSAAFYPFSRVPHVPPSVEKRLLEVATAALQREDPYRLMTLRALSRAGAAAAPVLEPVLLGGSSSYSMEEKVEAFRAVARLEKGGQALLVKAFESWAAAAPAELAKGAPEAQQLLAALALVPADPRFAKPLERLAQLPADGADERGKRILSMLRCRAAARLAASVTAPLLARCDLAGSQERKRAELLVLDRIPLGAAEKTLYSKLAADESVLVREEALELLVKHEGLPRKATLLEALRAKPSGVVIAALQLLAKHPRLAAKAGSEDEVKEGDKKIATIEPEVEITAAVKAILPRAVAEKEPEFIDACIDAIGALGARELLPLVEPFCRSESPQTRERAKNTITLLSGATPSCTLPEGSEKAPPEAARVAPEKLRLTFASDVGELVIVLDGTSAPVTTQRFAELARKGYFNGNLLHRVDPSYVVQFGSPDGDGFGGPTDVEPFRCETGPLPFGPLSVGVALSGRDTGKSQLFVTRARHPHIDGLYPLVGLAEGPWEKVIEGDVIRSVTVSE